MSSHNEISGAIVDSVVKVHTVFGPGLLESVYEGALAYELALRGLSVKRQDAIPVAYEGVFLGEGFRADLIVDNSVVVEIKSIESLAPVHSKVLLTYLRLNRMQVGIAH